MIVRMSPLQVAGARAYLTDRHREYFNPVEVSKARRDVDMPPAAWRALADILTERVFNPNGTRRGKAAKGGLAALQTIERALARLVAHPAFNGQWVVGASADLFTAWPDANVWWPYPVGDHPMRVLSPRFHETVTVNGSLWRGVTEWVDEDPLASPRPGLWLSPVDHAGWLNASSSAASSSANR